MPDNFDAGSMLDTMIFSGYEGEDLLRKAEEERLAEEERKKKEQEIVRFKNEISTTPRDSNSPQPTIWRDTQNVYERLPSGGIKVTQISSIPQAGAIGSNTPNEFRQSLKAIGDETDPVVAATMLADLKTQAQQLVNSRREEITQTLQGRYRITELETALRQNELFDQTQSIGNPRLQGVDGPTTASIRKTLMNARTAMDQEVEQLLARDVGVGSIRNNLELASKALAKVETRTASLEQKKLYAEYQQEMQDQALVASTDPALLERLNLLRPDLAGSSDAGKARYLKQLKDPALQIALIAPAEQLPMLTFSGNPYAAQALVKEEAKRTGQSEEEIKARVNQIAGMLQDPRTIQAALSYVKGGGKDVRSAYEQQKALAKTAEERAAFRQQEVNMVMSFYAHQQQQQLLGDTQKWGIADPAFVAAQTKAQNDTGRTDAVSVLSAYMAGTTGQERSMRMAQFFNAMKQVTDARSKSLIGAPDFDSMKQQTIMAVNKGMLESGFLKDLNTATNTVLGALDKPLQQDPLLQWMADQGATARRYLFGGSSNVSNQ